MKKNYKKKIKIKKIITHTRTHTIHERKNKKGRTTQGRAYERKNKKGRATQGRTHTTYERKNKKGRATQGRAHTQHMCTQKNKK